MGDLPSLGGTTQPDPRGRTRTYLSILAGTEKFLYVLILPSSFTFTNKVVPVAPYLVLSPEEATMNIITRNVALLLAAFVFDALAVEKELSPSLRKVAVSISFSVFWNGT